MKGDINETAATIKRRLWEGGLGRGAEMSTGARKVIARWEDIMLVYAGQMMADDVALGEYHVPPARPLSAPGRIQLLNPRVSLCAGLQVHDRHRQPPAAAG